MTITAKTKTVVALAEQAIEANSTEQELRRLQFELDRACMTCAQSSIAANRTFEPNISRLLKQQWRVRRNEAHRKG
jgi:hypothetical protein